MTPLPPPPANLPGTQHPSRWVSHSLKPKVSTGTFNVSPVIKPKTLGRREEDLNFIMYCTLVKTFVASPLNEFLKGKKEESLK